MPNPIPELEHAIEVAKLKYEIKQLRSAVKDHWSQKADDRCIEDDDKLYAAAGLPPCDRRVGSKEDMKRNCDRFIDNRCEGGGWPSYVELEELCKKLIKGVISHVQWEATDHTGKTPQEVADSYFTMMVPGVDALTEAQRLMPNDFLAIKDEICGK